MRLGVLVVLVCSLVFSACENALDIDGPSLDFTTEEFTGTLQPGGTAKHDFTRASLRHHRRRWDSG